MSAFQDHYAVLGVAPSADSEVIRAAYRVLAQRHHPDRNTTGDGAAMVRLNQAYAVLSCPQRRADYDRQHLHTTAHPVPMQAGPKTSMSASNTRSVLTTYDHRGRLHAYG